MHLCSKDQTYRCPAVIRATECTNFTSSFSRFGKKPFQLKRKSAIYFLALVCPLTATSVMFSVAELFTVLGMTSCFKICVEQLKASVLQK